MTLLSTREAGVQVRVRTDSDGTMFHIDRATSWPRLVVRKLSRGAELSLDAEGAQVAFVIGEGTGA